MKLTIEGSFEEIGQFGQFMRAITLMIDSVQPTRSAAGLKEDRKEPPSRESAAPLEDKLEECPKATIPEWVQTNRDVVGDSPGSVRKAPEISAARQDRNNENKLIVINGMEVLQFLDSEYHIEHLIWERSCAQIRKSFRKKTSRSEKNGKEYETTRWYRVMPDGSMKSTGSSLEPVYKEFYTPEPKVRYNFTVWVPKIRLQRDEHIHIVIEEKDYKENLKIFKDCLVFKLSNCENYMHPLYANPDMILSVRFQEAAGRAREDIKESQCWNDDGNCDTCEHQDECPVGPEEKDPEFPDDENEEGD